MGSCCGCLKKKKPNKSRSPLAEAKLMKRTKNGKTVCRKHNRKIPNRALIVELCRSNFECRILFEDQYIEFSQILYNLYLTGIGGIVSENIKEYAIRGIVSATYESGVFDVKGITTIRIPVDDDESENIGIYFDEVCDQMEKWLSHQQRVVVHCLCGISRSATLILAYLMKYKEMSLRNAFLYVKKKRAVIRPNNAFFQQLIDYEKKLFKRTSVSMITKKVGAKYIKIPDVVAELHIEEETSGDGQTVDSICSGTLTNQIRTLL